MQAIGQRLAEARKRLGLTFAEVERSTRIRTHHLEAIERGELEKLPSEVQAKGFLRNYADFLGLDASEILDQYNENRGLQTRRWPRRKAFHELPTRPSVEVRRRRPSWLSADLFVAAAITAVVLGVIVWGVGRLVTAMRDRTLAAQGNSAFLIPTFTPSAAPPIVEAAATSVQVTPGAEAALQLSIPTVTATLALELGAVGTAPVDLRILVERRSWLRVLVDGEELERRRAAPGEILEFQANEVIELTTGNGGGLRIFYNGQDQGPLGELGEVVVRLWTPEGAITPTPTVTPTPSPATPTQSPTSPSDS